ncbi:hypothetical protein B0H10DRAFT_1952923 [Mycena sp. CBHHK59/15]|nr:hypothetical protein B0H10DRAFT_1952923 [Mycena sp. CBHHK59/15]
MPCSFWLIVGRRYSRRCCPPLRRRLPLGLRLSTVWSKELCAARGGQGGERATERHGRVGVARYLPCAPLLGEEIINGLQWDDPNASRSSVLRAIPSPQFGAFQDVLVCTRVSPHLTLAAGLTDTPAAGARVRVSFFGTCAGLVYVYLHVDSFMPSERATSRKASPNASKATSLGYYASRAASPLLAISPAWVARAYFAPASSSRLSASPSTATAASAQSTAEYIRLRARGHTCGSNFGSLRHGRRVYPSTTVGLAPPVFVAINATFASPMLYASRASGARLPPIFPACAAAHPRLSPSTSPAKSSASADSARGRGRGAFAWSLPPPPSRGVRCGYGRGDRNGERLVVGRGRGFGFVRGNVRNEGDAGRIPMWPGDPSASNIDACARDSGSSLVLLHVEPGPEIIFAPVLAVKTYNGSPSLCSGTVSASRRRPLPAAPLAPPRSPQSLPPALTQTAPSRRRRHRLYTTHPALHPRRAISPTCVAERTQVSLIFGTTAVRPSRPRLESSRSDGVVRFLARAQVRDHLRAAL